MEAHAGAKRLPRISLTCKLVPVQYREYENGLLIAIESRMEDNFSNLHTQISELTCEFKHEINVVKSTMNELEKSVNHAWASIEDLQQESKALKD